MKISKIDSMPMGISAKNSNSNSNPAFKANFNMHTDVLYHRGKVNYWKSALERLTRWIEPLEPKSASVYLTKDAMGNAKITCTHPSLPASAVRTNAGQLDNPNIIGNVYDTVKSALETLKNYGCR